VPGQASGIRDERRRGEIKRVEGAYRSRGEILRNEDARWLKNKPIQ
jgi:hypothetical protein